MSVKMSRLFFKLCFIFSFLLLIKGENNDCGVVAKPKDNRIVGGEVIGYMKYPWFAALYQSENNKQLVCGGSLIGKRHVITAAHCYKPFFKDEKEGLIQLEDIYLVQLGTDNACISDSNTQIYGTLKVHIHEKYYDDLLYYDIALLLLDNVVNDFIPVCLPPVRYESNNRTGLIANVVGLGKESSTAWRLPCQVKEAKVEIQADNICRSFLDNNKQNGDNLHDAFCAGDGEGVIDTCQGDSGGPLQVEMVEMDERVMILGITSYGFSCAKKDTYGVYTDVSHYLDWINNKIKLDTNFKENSKKASIESTTPPTEAPVKKAVLKRQRKRKQTSILQQILNW